MPKNLNRALCAVGLLLCGTATVAATHSPSRSHYEAPQATTAVAIDGVANDAVWAKAEWRDLDQRWLGPEYSASDFSGRFKVAWSAGKLYIMAEIVDDILYDAHRNPLEKYWDDDCLEIFLDEDFSGGDHQYNHNAFAYHMSLDNQAIDIGTDEKAQNYSHHVESRWQQAGDTLVWELAIDVYDDSYSDDGEDNSPVELFAGKIMGLMVAYCDNDASELRENFVGSEKVLQGATDRGWIDAGIFGSLTLVE